MKENRNEHEQSEADVLSFDVSDDTIERAADGKAVAANPTVPSAIICIPL